MRTQEGFQRNLIGKCALFIIFKKNVFFFLFSLIVFFTMVLALSGGDNSPKGENVNIWLLNYIKSHGGPYEIPQECRQSWDLMKCFLSDSVFDKKTKEKKRKGIIIQGLLSCCTELIEEIKGKKQKILEHTQSYEVMEKGLNERMSDLRLHAPSLLGWH